ncbi:MAG: heat-inducible transcription repressor HrcA [Clostridia bacterium]|nr:heat-inducible transcription repressor HrcA [Clostridia bacterium]
MPDKKETEALSERKKQILANVVELYIKTGEPVGSKGLIDATGMSVSSATVRNEMNELDSMGYLEQPHTSAGRVPTQEGYRYYVDHLMKNREVDELTKRLIDAGVSSAVGDPEKLIAKSREILANLTKCATVSTAPVGEMTLIKKIEVVPVGAYSAMMVLLTSNGILKSRLCRSDTEINASVLEKFYGIAGAFIIGKPAAEITPVYIQTLAAAIEGDYFTLLPLLAAVTELADSVGDSRLVLGGSSNLLSFKDYGEGAVALLEFLSRSEPLSDVINSSRGSLDVRIGSENKYKQLENSSVIVSKYSVNGDETGTISVIGPTRMDYETIIPSIRYMTDIVGRLITQALEE